MEHSKIKAHLVLMLSLLLLILFVSCKPVAETTDSSNTPTTDEGVQVQEEQTYLSSEYVNQIEKIAASSTCASYSWASRGRAPLAYIKGMALTYARSLCRLKKSEAAPTGLITLLSRSAGNAATDALALFESTFSSLVMNISDSGEGPLKSLYTLGIGLGMRESSGKYCEGRDLSASNTTASTAEAGMFQTSYDSMSASIELSKLYAEYKADTSKCLLSVFRQGVTCGSNSIAGSGAGAEYQAFNKSCPAFAAEYAMVMLRVRRNHYGPINRKEAEVAPVCEKMLQSVQTLIEDGPYACDEII